MNHLNTGAQGKESAGTTGGRQAAVGVNGVQLSYQEWGAGEPLVCAHGGMGLDSSYFKSHGILKLASDKRRVVLYDQRGHGRSGRSPMEAYTHAQWAADLGAFAAAIAPGKFALLGHSYGGVIALEFAVRHPEALSHLILVDTSAGPVIRQVPEIHDNVALAKHFRRKWLQFFPGTEKRWDVFDRLSFSWEPFVRAFRDELPNYDVRAQVRNLTMPTLLIVGSEDAAYMPDIEWLAGQLPQARKVIIPGAGHFPFIDAPETFSTAVTDFLGA